LSQEQLEKGEYSEVGRLLLKYSSSLPIQPSVKDVEKP